jgi:putative superfamily III holin-X
MVAQTTMNSPGGGDPSPPRAVARNTGELLSDALTLAELQSKLLWLDVQSDLSKLITPLALMVIGVVLALSCLPIALATLALGLVAGAGLPPWLAFLIALGVGLLLAAILAGIGVWVLLHGTSFLSRSRSEWGQNIRWFKNLVRRLGERTNRSTASAT